VFFRIFNIQIISVKSWEGNKSNVEKQVNEDYWMNKRDKDTSCDYDDEIDAGKVCTLLKLSCVYIFVTAC
jgi:hypothetical protein